MNSNHNSNRLAHIPTKTIEFIEVSGLCKRRYFPEEGVLQINILDKQEQFVKMVIVNQEGIIYYQNSGWVSSQKSIFLYFTELGLPEGQYLIELNFPYLKKSIHNGLSIF